MGDPSATDPLRGARVLLGISGGIAAYKAAILARLLVRAGAEVDVILTRGAERFVGPTTFEGLTGRPVGVEVWEDVAAGTHVGLGQAAEVAVVYPATAHTLAKLAVGLADDLLTTTLLACTAPLVLAPAMHTEMWQHPATRANVTTLRQRGAVLVGPDDGLLMGGDCGPGRLVDPEEVLFAVRSALGGGVEHPGTQDGTQYGTQDGAPDGATVGATSDPDPAPADLTGQRVLVTAGGTREPLDPVRYLGNRSSGRMGFALAAAAVRRGAEVVLVAAPTALPTPAGVTRIDVTTALELHAAVFDHLAGTDVVVKAAAVADFRPAEAASSKLKKDRGVPTITLVPNPDVLADLAAARGTAAVPVLVGFAAETDEVEEHGRSKLARKGADLLVVNDVSAGDAGFEVDTNRVVILDRDGGREVVPLASKAEVAERIWDRIGQWRSSGPDGGPPTRDVPGAG